MGALYTYSCPVGMHVYPPQGTKAQEITGHGEQCLFCAVDYAGRDEISQLRPKRCVWLLALAVYLSTYKVVLYLLAWRQYNFTRFTQSAQEIL